MNRYIKAILSAAVVAVYLLLLRYVAPSNEPYFILGTAVIGLVAWLCGSVTGLATALFLIPATNYVYQQFAVLEGTYNLLAMDDSIRYVDIATSPAYIALQLLAAVALGFLGKYRRVGSRKATELEAANKRLQGMLESVQELGGIHNLCGGCKKIQDEYGRWHSVDDFLSEHTKMEFSHCMCPACAEHFSQASEPREPA